MLVNAMVDDCKEFRRLKPQQKFYKPGSGPLRRSRYGIISKMDAYSLDSEQSTRDHNHYGSHNSVNHIDETANYRDREPPAMSARQRKPEQQLYVPRPLDSGVDAEHHMRGIRDSSSQYKVNRQMANKQDKHNFNSTGSYSRGASRRDFHYKDGASSDINFNRHCRQVSETRSISPNHSAHNQSSVDRNRDSRSMETSSGRHLSGSGGKPPSGRRNSAGYPSDLGRSKYNVINLDNIPPRFRKKYLEQSGHHSFDSVDQISKDRLFENHPVQNNYAPSHFHNTNPSWSQTLPSRGRGRLRENDGFDREKFMSSFLKSYDPQSGRSTPSTSYTNLYESNSVENNDTYETTPFTSSTDVQNEYAKDCNAPKNRLNNTSVDASTNHIKDEKQSVDSELEGESISQMTSHLLDMTLDWTEEVEKNIKLDDMSESSVSFSQNLKSISSQDFKSAEAKDSKRSGRARRRDRRSSSRGQRNAEKKTEKSRKDSNASLPQDIERHRKDSNVSIQHEVVVSSLKQRERRDSHRSNRSSTIGNSRDDLDRWRSLRSYSREQSTERRIVSQCNSRETSTNRALSPRGNDGFRMPNAVNSKPSTWSSTNQKKNGRTVSSERGRQSPAPTNAASGGAGGGEAGGGGRRSRKRQARRRARLAEPNPNPPGATPVPHNLNWREEIIESKKQAHDKPSENTHQRNRLNSAMSEKSSISESSTSHPGILILPHSSVSHMQKDQGRGGSVETQKTLFDHHNPSKPIIVQTCQKKIDVRMERGAKESSTRGGGGGGGGASESGGGEAARAARHRALLQQVDRADAILQAHTLRGALALAAQWGDVIETRKFLQNALEKLLMSDLKFCQSDNIEHQFWKILYYNFIEISRRSFTQVSPEDKVKIVNLLNIIIEEGNTFFENLVQALEKCYKFNTDDYINDNHLLPPKGLGYVGLALVSVQKLYVFLGDLARYKEQVNETNNYAKSKYWYTKAQQINPKNGRPYNQLAILAIYARRKLDAVYYYMRSLMSSNPFHSARESLLSLFDENRKKYETAERKRRAALESTSESGESTSVSNAGGAGRGLRREVWVRPGGHRTTRLRRHQPDHHLAAMTPVELNKNFITSYLHVHGKLITKIGMETFHECAGQMLRQFRALLHRQPLPTPAARLLQLTALNMFAVETTAASLRDGSSGGERSAWLECALGVALLMFGALLERCCALLPEPPHSQQHSDALLLLPAIKVWSDWMLCHSSVWNPPPTFDNFDLDSENDPWDWLAKLMNIIEALDDKTIQLENEPKEGYTSVRLPEDSTLSGFTPLMYMEPAAAWVRSDPVAPPHAAEHALRTRKLLFFGTEYLVGVEPPALKLECPPAAPPRYVSAVQRPAAAHAPLAHLSEDSEDESSASGVTSGPTSLSESVGAPEADEATRKLLKRKEQLESTKASLDLRRQRVQEILRGGWVSVEVEVRPRWLVPDTNCFIDHLPLLQAVEAMPGQPYLLAVPLVVMSELEGLCRCARVGPSARAALSWVSAGTAGVRLATARGTLLASRAFTAERDEARASNDDRVLATALNLHASLATEPDTTGTEGIDSKCVRRLREVVLLTDDRNLRVKALAAELPVRDLPSFVHWTGLDTANTKATGIDDSTSTKT